MAQSKRKILLFLLAFICAVCVALFCASCSGDSTDSSSSSGSESSSDDGGTGGGSGNTPEEEQTVWELIADNLGTDYTITVKDISITIPDIEAYQIYANTSGDVMFYPNSTVFFKVYDNAVTFDAGEMYISVSESNGDYTVVAYASGEITLENATYDYTEVYSAELYCDGETIYIVYSVEEDGVVADKYVITADYSYLSESVAESTSDYDVSGIVEQLSAVTELTSLIDSSSDLVTTALETIFTVTETTSGGYTLTLDYTALTALLNNLNDCTVAEFVDVYAGTGTYAGLQTLADSLGDMTVYNAISAIFTFTAEYGLSQESTYSLINSVVAAVTGSTFDMESLFASGGFLYTIGTMNFDEFLTTYLDMDTEDISLYLSAYSDLNAFEALYFSTDLYYYWYLDTDEAFEYLMDCYTAITDTLSVVINVASDGSISTDVTLNGYSFVESESLGATLTASGEITISSGATLPSTATSVVTDSNTIYAEVAAAMSALEYDNDYIIVANSVAYYSDGLYSLEISASTSASVISLQCYDGNYYIYFVDDTAEGYIILYADVNDDDEIVYNYYSDVNTYSTDGYTTQNIEIDGAYVYVESATYNTNGDDTYYSYAIYYQGKVAYSETEIHTYDVDGNLTFYSYVNTDVSYTETYTYNADGTLATCVYVATEDGKVTNTYTEKYTYKYDEYDNLTSYTYEQIDSDGNVTYTSTATTVYTYENGNVIKSVETIGNTTFTAEYTYYDDGSFKTYSYTQAYSDDDYSWSSTEAYEYDEDGEITAESYSDEETYGDNSWSCTETYTYGEYGEISYSYVEKEDGNVVISWTRNSEYDEDGNVTKRVEKDGSYTTTYTYTYYDDGSDKTYGYETKYNDNFMYSRYYEYDENGHTTKDEYFDGTYTSTYTYTYDEDGNRTYSGYERSYIDEENVKQVVRSWAYTYNSNGILIKEEYYSSSYSYTTTYDSNGNILKDVYYSDGYSYTATYTYDDYGYEISCVLVEVEGEETTTTTFTTVNTYDEDGNLTKSVETNDKNTSTYTTTFAYGDDGNVTAYSYKYEYESAVIYSWSYEYDDNGNETKAVENYGDGYIYTTTREYDTDGNLTDYLYTVTEDEDETVIYSYAETYTYTDGLLTKGEYIYTYIDDEETEIISYTYTYAYDEDNVLATYTAEYSCVTITVTASGSETETDTAKYVITIGSKGNKASETYTDSEGYSYTRTWNDDGYILTAKFVTTTASGTLTETYTYTYTDDNDYLTIAYENTNEEWFKYTFTYDEDGNLLSHKYESSDEDAYTYTYTYTYYKNGTVKSEKCENCYNYTWSRTYYSNGSLESYSSDDGNGNTETDTYYKNGIFKSIYVKYTAGDNYTYNYDEDGNLTYYKYVQADESYEIGTFTYYDDGSTASESVEKSDGTKYEATYDEDGNFTTETGTYIDEDGTSSTYMYTYTYDKDGNCITETLDYGSGMAITNCTYDDNGNLLTENYAKYANYADVATYTYTATYTYEDGKLAKIAYENSDNETYSFVFEYNEDGWTSSQKKVDSDGTTTTIATYSYDVQEELGYIDDYGWGFYVTVIITYYEDGEESYTEAYETTLYKE